MPEVLVVTRLNAQLRETVEACKQPPNAGRCGILTLPR